MTFFSSGKLYWIVSKGKEVRCYREIENRKGFFFIRKRKVTDQENRNTWEGPCNEVVNSCKRRSKGKREEKY